MSRPMTDNLKSGTPLIRLDDIRKTYHNGDLAVEVLHGITLDIQAGEFVAIMGASGSGKSTLMNILGCLDSPSGGQYLLDGEDVSTLDADALAALRRRTFGFVFQSYNLISTSTAQENVEVPAIYAGLPASERHARAAELLNQLKLGDRLDHRPNQLSGGQQQRVSIARALMNGGRIILADEPTGALDSQSGEDVMELLRSMHQQGHTVIVITHAREVAERADRLIEIRDGQILSDTVKRAIPDTQAPLRLRQTLDGSSARIADVSEAVKMAMRALKANIFRTILTLLGIIIGVSSVVTMLAIGTGAQNSILDRINAMGTDLILVRPSMAGFRGTGSIATLVPEDATAILELPNIKTAVPEVTGTVTLRRGNVDYQSQANGTVPAFSEAKSWKVATGDFISQSDMDNYAPVAVLGKTVVNTLFPDGSNPIGQYILIQKIPFQVIGTLEPKGAGFGGSDQDDVVVVPLSTGNLRLFGQKYVRTITVQVKDSDLINTTQEQIQDLLDQRHKKQDTMITNMSSIREDATAMGNTMTLFLGSVAAISLLVGGIGVMNIMLVSVTERTREIGVRMATGARRRDILLQFITEALTVSAIGGAFGVVIGLGAAAIAGWAGLSVGYSVGPVMLAFACAFATGLIFGFLPARKASRLLPAVALSSE
ncbi:MULTISPECIES: MacB family efflux pump subunit [Brucella/Ochrobactrum group]|uniref:Pyoverdine export ATP-binding/permease protein PvdT n=1 Tax=Brucella pseudintermedia TaxID=370111 RepID=A0ABY5U8T6_9HYPH|nr:MULTISPECIES: MacB family efflux pump subunit [Brucella/Ochrobactrum group]KAB2680103.1 MacB family efflux pump subunit [Brucella pseudintermedia]NKE77612.1 MacB family efflux pump subunit [Ochrobactrum sp. MC-1LL]TWG95343.1 macrolide transport system ATP-binding/permease protein [Ochrobactrum sp. J50]UWL59266.1 MacB family efflux pump subunit [Brucella pseudintermedia]WPM79685.1 MacB family efflux pump subunit [Brucella pseudintermedia]